MGQLVLFFILFQIGQMGKSKRFSYNVNGSNGLNRSKVALVVFKMHKPSKPIYRKRLDYNCNRIIFVIVLYVFSI